MTYPNWSDDAALAKALRTLYLAEVERAAREPHKALVSVRGNVRMRTPGWSLLGVAAAVSILVVVAVSAQLGHASPSTSGSNGGTTGSVSSGTASAPTRSAPPTPAGISREFGPFVGGIPETVDGQSVLVGSSASAAIQSSTDDSSILVGGWLHNSTTFCAFLAPDLVPWDTTCFGYNLLSRPMSGTTQIAVAQGLSSNSIERLGEGSVLPIVLRVHTHDRSCPPGLRIDCAHLAVLDEVVWRGNVEPMPSPASTPPASGIARQDAIASAVRFAGEYSSISPHAVSAVDGPYLTVAPPGADIPGDHWVWAITVTGSFPAPDCASFDPATPPCLPNVKTQLVVIDYATGSVLLAEAPAPTAPPPA